VDCMSDRRCEVLCHTRIVRLYDGVWALRNSMVLGDRSDGRFVPAAACSIHQTRRSAVCGRRGCFGIEVDDKTWGAVLGAQQMHLRHREQHGAVMALRPARCPALRLPYQLLLHSLRPNTASSTTPS